MQNLEKFTEMISILRSLKGKVHVTQLERFSTLLTELTELRTKVYPERKEEARRAFEYNKSAFQLSSFELMEFNYRENSHSNILQYLFDYNLIGDKATEILTEFVKLCNYDNCESLIEKINKKNYEVIREKITKENKRIDLFIIDEVNNFVIIIENKILANVTETIPKIEETVLVPKTQLDGYKKFVEDNYSTYEKLFILLNYEKINEDYRPYIKINTCNLKT